MAAYRDTAYRDNFIVGVSWSGALFGLVLGVTTYFLLAILGVAIGGSTFSFQALNEIGWGAILWACVTSAIAAFVAGYSATRAAPALTTKTAGYCTGALAGALLLMALTFVTVSSIASIGRAAMGLMRGAASALPDVQTSQVAGSLGIDTNLQNIAQGFDRGDIERAIAQASPELGQNQVRAATDSVINVVNESASRISNNLGNVSGLGDLLNREGNTITQQLSGSALVQRLQQQGLTPEQAQRTTGAIEQRTREFRDKLQQASSTVAAKAEEVSKSAAGAISRAAWGWLFIGVLVLGLSTFGGGRASDVDSYSDIEEYERRREERAPLHH